MAEQTNGKKTTEFWLVVAASIYGVLVSLGIITPEQADQLDAAGRQIVGSILMIVPIASYAISRGIRKKNLTKNDA